MKKINHKIMMPTIFSIVMILVYFLNRDIKEKTEPVSRKLKFNKRVEFTEKNEVVNETMEKENDINTLTKAQMVSLGLTEAISEKIVEYKKKTGTVREFDELTRVKGIGEKTLLKIKRILSLNEKYIGKKNKLSINNATNNELQLYGFTKKEIHSLEKWKNDKGVIFSNLDLIKIIGERRYDEIKDDISY